MEVVRSGPPLVVELRLGFRLHFEALELLDSLTEAFGLNAVILLKGCDFLLQRVDLRSCVGVLALVFAQLGQLVGDEGDFMLKSLVFEA